MKRHPLIVRYIALLSHLGFSYPIPETLRPELDRQLHIEREKVQAGTSSLSALDRATIIHMAELADRQEQQKKEMAKIKNRIKKFFARLLKFRTWLCKWR